MKPSVIWRNFCHTASKCSRPFLQSEVGEVVGAELVAQEGGELFVLLEEAVLPVGAEDVMAVFDSMKLWPFKQ